MRRLNIKRDVFGIVVVSIAFYLGAGTLTPYFPLWLKARGMSAGDIAVILAIPAVARVIAAPFFGYVGDMFGQRRAIRVTATVAVVAGALLFFSSRSTSIMLLTVITYTCWLNLPVQIDSVTANLVRTKVVLGFGSVRGFGSSAFAVATLLGTLVLTHFGPNGILAAFVVLAIALILIAAQLPVGGGGASALAKKVSIRALLRPGLVSVLFAASLVHAANSAFITFGAIHMRALGYSNPMLGIVIATVVGTEIVTFFFGHLVTHLLRTIQWITLAAAVAVLRWTATAFVVNPYLLIAVQLLHAVTFCGTYIGVFGLLIENVDQRRMASAQGIYVTLFGASSAILIFGIGQAFDHLGGKSFLFSAVSSAVALAIMGVRYLVLRKR